MKWETIIQKGKYVGSGAHSIVYELVDRTQISGEFIHTGRRNDGAWFASWSGSNGAINIDVDNMDDAKATALALYRMR